MRIDKFSKQELRESQTTFNELTSQIKELQDGVNIMNDLGEFQDVESVSSGGLLHVPNQTAVVPNSRGVLSRDQSLRPDTWNSLGTTGTFLTIHLHQSTQCRHLTDECCTLGILKLHSVTQCSQVRDDLQVEVKKKQRYCTHAEICKKSRGRIFIELYG